MLVALAATLPLVLLSAGVVWRLAENERENRRDAILYSSRTLMNTVDALLSKHVAIAQMLATSPALMADDLAAFRQEAERALPGLSGAWVLVTAENGQQLVNLARPVGETLPVRNPTGTDLMREAIRSGKIQISNVMMGGILPNPVVSVEVPVLRPDKPSIGLSIIMDTRAFLPVFATTDLPDGWLAGLIDRSGNFIARSRDHDGQVGRPASEGFRRVAQEGKEGWHEINSVEGSPLSQGHVTSDLSGWVMAVAADKDAFEAPIRQTVQIAALASGAAILLSVLLAYLAARKIAGPIDRIEHGAHALMRREALTFGPTGIPEIDRALDAFGSTAQALEQHEKERDEREAHVHLIMRELSHRSKNLLAIVLAIARQTARNTRDFSEFESRFGARIQALADAHDLLVEQQWSGAALDGLVRAQLSAFGIERVTISGRPVMLRAEAVQNVTLALHELATNASKYGALSVAGGKVAVSWELEGNDETTPILRLTWRESGGPPVKPPERKGFGCFVLERVTVNALGEGRLEFDEAGLVWTCLIKVEHIASTKPGEPPKRRLTDHVSRRAS